jgi:hypothetical protein
MTKSLNKLEQYKDYLENGIKPFFDNMAFIQIFDRVPKSRYHTYKYCFEEFEKNKMSTIVELGTSRSFVDGRFEGCNSNESKYWEPNNPDKWDWSSGFFTKVAPTCLNHLSNFKLHTVDSELEHISRSKLMNKENSKIINYYISKSEDFLNSFTQNIDLLYIDTGDLTPVKVNAYLHLREVEIVVAKNLMKSGGLIVIDDVRSCVSYQHGENIDKGIGYLAIPYLLENGFEVVMDEYQTVLRKL